MTDWNGLIRWNPGFEYIIPIVGSTQEKSKISPEDLQGQTNKNPGPDQKQRTWGARVILPPPPPPSREPLHAPNHANSSRLVHPYLRTHVSESPSPWYQARPLPQTPLSPSLPALLFAATWAEVTEGRTNRGPNSLGRTQRNRRQPVAWAAPIPTLHYPSWKRMTSEYKSKEWTHFCVKITFHYQNIERIKILLSFCDPTKALFLYFRLGKNYWRENLTLGEAP